MKHENSQFKYVLMNTRNVLRVVKSLKVYDLKINSCEIVKNEFSKFSKLNGLFASGVTVLL